MKMFFTMLLVVGVLFCSIMAQAANARYPYSYGYYQGYQGYQGYSRSYRYSNPYVDRAPRIYDYRGRYRGKLSNDRYDPDSISNPLGRFGNKYSTHSVHNPYITGNW